MASITFAPEARCPAPISNSRARQRRKPSSKPQHDFPKRIIYRKTGDDGLTATIDAGEAVNSMSFVFQRIKLAQDPRHQILEILFMDGNVEGGQLVNRSSSRVYRASA